VKIAGTYTINAPREVVWAALNDIDVLARVVPGCEKLEQHGENEFEGTVKIGIQAIKGVYSGRIRLEDVQPPTHYKLVAAGRGSNGMVDGTGSVDLEEQDGKTLLKYGGSAAISGTLASVGQRLMEGAAKQLINQSLKALDAQVKLRMNPPEPVNIPEPAPQPTPTPVAAVEAAPAVATAQAVTNNGVVPTPVEPTPTMDAAPSATPTFQRRSVVVPEHEQLKPESVLSGMLHDLIREKPWYVLAIVFALGYLVGRSRRS
jgi:carbon monoxide dehydrogenase subunit G